MTLSKHTSFLMIVAVMTAFFYVATAQAGKPDKPGGGDVGENGEGVIYFRYESEMYTMNDDGREYGR